MKNIADINQRILYIFFVYWIKHLFRIEIKGNINNINSGIPLVIISNHVSMWDPFVIFSALGFKLFLGESWRTPASHELYKNKFYSTFLKSMGSYPIKPLGSFEKSLDLTIKKINKGHSIVYFPEGRRSFNSRGGMPRKGVGYLLKSIETNILPIYIEYPNRFKPWRGRVILGNVVNSSYLSKYFNGSNMHEKTMNLVWDLRQ